MAFPDKIKTFENESPILSVSNVLIDRTGITGSIRGENVIQYPRGNFGDWGASIDTVNIELVSSSLQSGSLKGKIKVSIADSCFLYSGLLAKNNTVPNSPNKSSLQYQFSIVPKDTIDIDLWKSKLNLYPTSVIELLDTTGKFEGKAVLNGNLSLEGDAGGLSKLDFKGLTFENFKVMTKSPYIEKGNWNFASPQHGMAGFPVSINNIDVVTGSRSGSFGAGIKFNLNIGLQPGANAISGTTTLSVWGKMASGTGAQHFEFDGVDLDSIGVDADLGTVKIKGGLSLFDAHATFGNGFRGAVSATFVDQVAVEATAQFGSVNNFRYWYVDSKALFPTGLPMFSGLGIYGFGGGAWYHMRKSGQTDLSDPPTEADKGTTAGTTNSGYQFTPDKNTEFGLNASMIMGTHPSPEAFNGDVGLETQFLSDGGIGTMTLVGEGYLLCSITNRQKAKILADMNMEYNFPTKTFHGVFDVDINANPLDGGGQMLMHFAPDLWYIKIGEPSNRINVNLADWLEADGYFMAGQNLPPPPPLPATIMELFPDYEANRSSLISTGDGFAFGASSGFDTGRKKYLIFYGDISAIVGFDLALLNLGEGTICTGQTETIGVNGWYAMGQVYAALAASIGLHVDLWFTSGNYEILNLQVGAALQGAGPNPTWVRGSVGGNYRILNGAVKGHCNFQFSMGEPCEVMIESPLARIDLISDINPVSGQNGVDVFTEPQVAMNFQLDTPFEIKEMATNETSGKIRTFRIQLDEFSLRKTSGSDSIQGRKNIGPDKYSACYTPHDMMAGHTRYRFSVAAFGEEYLNGQWQVARKNNGTIIKQNVSSIFKTGPTPKNIPLSNVAFTYPVSSQQYFLQDECRNGRIQLKIGQPELFIPREGFSLELLARFIPIDFNLMPVEVPYSYNPSAKSITFEIPNLLNDKGYYLQIIKKETCTDPNIALMQQLMGQLQEGGLQPSITLFEEKLLERGSSNVFLNRRKISSTKVRSGEKLLHVLYFKTSKFNTLQAKLATFAHTLTETEPGPNSYETHRATYQGAENFGYYDFNPVTSSSYSTQLFGPLIKVNASSRSSEWHTQFTNPQIYDEIAWMKSMGLWSGTVKYEQYLTNQDYHFVDIEYNRHKPGLNEIANLLSGTPTGNSSGTTSTTGTNENFPGNTFAPGGLASTNLSGLLSMGNGSETPNLQLTYNHGKIAASDFNKLTNRALSVLSNPFINKSGVTRNRLQAIVNRNYQMMYRGSYPLWFFYHNVGCYGIDDTVPTISKPFIY